MDARSADSETRLVLLGGGHSHALVLKMLGSKPMGRVKILVVSDVTHAPYSGMLPGHVAGFYSWSEMHIDLVGLAAHAGVAFVQARVEGLDLAQKCVRLEGLPALAYDLLSINTGITPDAVSISAGQRAVPVKPVSGLLEALDRLEQCMLTTERRVWRLAIIGAGAGGVELAMALAARFGTRVTLTVFDAQKEIALTHAPRARRLLRRELARQNIRCELGQAVLALDEKAVVLADRSRHAFDLAILATFARPPSWLKESGLAVDEGGFIKVAETLQSVSHPNIFAAGDVASMAGHSRPKSGVFAVRQGAPLGENLRRAADGHALAAFVPQRTFLSLIGTGRGEAIASWAGCAYQSHWLWTHKQRIDRRFMAMLSEDKVESSEQG